MSQTLQQAKALAGNGGCAFAALDEFAELSRVVSANDFRHGQRALESAVAVQGAEEHLERLERVKGQFFFTQKAAETASKEPDRDGMLYTGGGSIYFWDDEETGEVMVRWPGGEGRLSKVADAEERERLEGLHAGHIALSQQFRLGHIEAAEGARQILNELWEREFGSPMGANSLAREALERRVVEVEENLDRTRLDQVRAVLGLERRLQRRLGTRLGPTRFVQWQRDQADIRQRSEVMRSQW